MARPDETAVEAGNAEIAELDADAVQHPEEIVIRNDEQRGGILERLVVGELVLRAG